MSSEAAPSGAAFHADVEQQQQARRTILIAVTDTPESEIAFGWALEHLYRGASDELHLVHVIPRLQFAAAYGVPPVDFIPTADSTTYEDVIKRAEQFIIDRFVRKLPASFPSPPIVHIIKSEVDTESVGHVLVKKAAELRAVAIVMASHHRGRVSEMFLGSVTHHVTHQAQCPVVVVPPHHHR